MALFKGGNPALSESKFRDTILDDIVAQGNTMTVKGTLNKFGVLFLLMLASSYYSWKEAAQGGDAWTLILVGVFGGLAIAVLMSFKKQWSQYLAPVYALLEGLFVGAVSAYFEYSVAGTQDGNAAGYSGIVLQAVGLTFAVVGVMFLLYKFKIIQATPLFKKVIITATIAIAIFYMVCWVITLMGSNAPSFIFQGTPLGIGFSMFVVALAALNLILNFDIIEKGAEMGAPKYMEWYGAFGLLVTIVWLYLEILRLLSKLNRR
jgi:uncharacterized YccA/Bax inhibitor family protein